MRATAPPARGGLRKAAGQVFFSGSDNAFALRIVVAFVACWTVFQIIAFSSVSLHTDLTEIYAWSLQPSASYHKHPPLTALMAHVWFSIFPVADWSFHLLAMCNAGLGLFFTDMIARRYLDRDKRLLVLLLLMLTPFYQFHGQRFNANQVLLSLWPIATWCFLRSFETRSILWGAAAGAAAAAAMLGKYFSGCLIIAFIVAALIHRERMRYLLSPAPWASILVGFLVLAPHLLWLWTNGPQTIDYAFNVHGREHFAETVGRSAGYITGLAGYAALPLAVWWLAVRPTRATLRDVLRPSDPERRMLAALFIVPLAVPAILGPILHRSGTPIWAMQAYFLLPILLLAPPSVSLPHQRSTNVAIGVAAATLFAIAVSPLVAWTYHSRGIDQGRSYAASLANDVSREWRGRFGTRLSIVSGDDNLAPAVTFYSPDHPDFVFRGALWMTPWVTPERIAREGAAIVCRASEAIVCGHGVQVLGTDEQRLQKTEITLASHFLGTTTRPQKFLIWFLPPAAARQ